MGKIFEMGALLSRPSPPKFDCQHTPPPLPSTYQYTQDSSPLPNRIPGLCRTCHLAHCKQEVDAAIAHFDGRKLELMVKIADEQRALKKRWCQEKESEVNRLYSELGLREGEKRDVTYSLWRSYGERWAERKIPDPQIDSISRRLRRREKSQITNHRGMWQVTPE